MERNGIEEAERGLRPLHCSDPGEGEREGRVGRKSLGLQFKKFWQSQWRVLKPKSPGEE